MTRSNYFTTRLLQKRSASGYCSRGRPRRSISLSGWGDCNLKLFIIDNFGWDTYYIQNSHAKFGSHSSARYYLCTTSSYDAHNLASSHHGGYFKTYCVLWASTTFKLRRSAWFYIIPSTWTRVHYVCYEHITKFLTYLFHSLGESLKPVIGGIYQILSLKHRL